jgi:uncharacterized protein (TIGR03435 family)
MPEIKSPGFAVMIRIGAGGAPSAHIAARAQPVSALATTLGNVLNHPVVDKTGLTGRYDFNIEYTPDLIMGLPALPGLPPGPLLPPPPGTARGDGGASEPGSNLAAAVQQQLGLRLVPGKATLDMIVVDKAEKVPTEN